MEKKDFKKWSVGFSAKVLKIITAAWLAFMVFTAVMMAIGLHQTGSLYDIGTFIVEINKTFCAAVVGILITRTVGNIFEYNDGGIFGISRRGEEESPESEEEDAGDT